jgi:hypothetical protein
MITIVLHLLICSALIGAAFYRIARAGTAPTAHRFLFPYIAVAALTGLVIAYLYGMELFVAYYSGAGPAHAAAKLRLDGPYGWLYISLVVFPLLPAIGILPWIGRRPLAVALLGVLAPLPELLMTLGMIMAS